MTNILNDLLDILHSDIESIDKLLNYLNDEKQLLIKSDFNQLPEFADKKQKLIDKIETNNLLKVNLLSPLKQSNDSLKVMEVLAKEYGEAETGNLRQLNSELEEKLSQCRHQNAVNGQAIVRSLKNNQELIDIVVGKTKSQELYNSFGKSIDSNSSKSYYKEI